MALPSYAQLIDDLLDLTNREAQQAHLTQNLALLNTDFGMALKERADMLLRADIRASLGIAQLLLLAADVAENPELRALGLLAEANARSIGLGEYQAALLSYDRAATIYAELGQPAAEARSQIGKLWALACLGLYDQALETGAWAGRVLEEHAQWRPLATLTMNLAIIHGRQGADAAALAMFERAGEVYARLGEEGAAFLPLIDQNCSIVLRNLGLFDRSIAASQQALERLNRLEQPVEAARARQNLAITHFVLGRYNEALDLLDSARETFLKDGRQRDALLAELFSGECLLQLRRFSDVLQAAQRIRELFSARGTRLEVGQTLLNEAAAYSGLQRYDEAIQTLSEAATLFATEENWVWAAAADLERAAVLLRQGLAQPSLELAKECAETFSMHALPLREAQAQLLAARAAALAQDRAAAEQMAHEALAAAESAQLPAISYQCRHLLGRLAASTDTGAALAYYDAAIADLERLRGQLMVEFRADFLEDKQAIYEDVVALCISQGRPEAALDYVERARSRALIDMLAKRVDLSIQARRGEDIPLVEELNQLRTERDRLLRRWQSREAAREDGPPTEQERLKAQQAISELERRITASWHRLLVHNADYARDATLWQAQLEPVQPFLDQQTLLLNFFTVHGRVLAIAVSAAQIITVELGELRQIERLSRLLALNLRSAPGNAAERVAALMANAQHLLQQLYGLLIRPLEGVIVPFGRLIIVPHGSLHYLPFHALYSGARYLLEDYEISYLPTASLLRHIQPAPASAQGALVFGYSYNKQLPYALEEAKQVAELLGVDAHLEDDATLERLRDTIGGQRVVHLATHGDFRLDNPLFSGLALADSWLTTLESFNLQLQASLVTLSACETGRSRVGGGDELQGLMRALLHAGAATLLLSLWTVEDLASARLMHTFYDQLKQGQPKAAALRQAQRNLIAAGGIHAHPYFWAAFFRVGDSGVL